MIYRLAVVCEICAIVACIHRIYNKKIKLDIATVSLYLGILATLEVIVHFGWNNISSLCTFIYVVLYCIRKYKDKLIGATISSILMYIVVALMQFMFVLPVVWLIPQNEEVRMLITNLLTAVFSLWILPKLKIHKLRAVLRKRDNFIIATFGIVVFFICIIAIEGKLTQKIHLAFFVLIVPVLIFLLWILNKWSTLQDEKEVVQNELAVTKDMQGEYEDLLTAVRLREHGFKNHLTALLSIRHTNKSYDELVREQDKYYEIVREENKYNKLLFVGDSTISGFLYEKFRDAEEKGISVIYEIKGCISLMPLSIYHLVEMLGILIDNAVEAQTEVTGRKRIKFQFEEKESRFIFTISNPYKHVSYKEMELWFCRDNSTKGKNRGLGLYYIKKLCEDNQINIICNNAEYEHENWIEMTLEIKKADK